jgi:basic membrane protein A and related proteins
MDFKHLLALASACAFFINPAHAQTVKPAAKPSAPLDVGFVYVSPVTEAGWTFQHDQGRKAMEKALGAAVKTRFVDKVAEGADAERVIRDMATTGSKLIFTTSFGFMEPTLKVAKEFPNTQFVHVSGYKTASNVANVNARFYEGRYLAGYLAGKSSKSGVAGYVAAFPIPEVLQGVNAFALGMRQANPKAQVKLIWTASWFDPAREADASKALIAQGADVLTHHTDSGAVAIAAESAGVKVIAYHSDMKSLAPKAQLAAVTHHWDAYYTKATQQALAGSWKTSSEWNGMATGAVKLSSVAASVPKEVVASLAALEKSIKDGKKAVFTGELKDNTGKVQHSGAAMSDAQLNSMNYLLDGVVGSLPK